MKGDAAETQLAVLKFHINQCLTMLMLFRKIVAVQFYHAVFFLMILMLLGHLFVYSKSNLREH